MATEPSFVNKVLFTPVKDDAVWDLGEYMRVKPKVERVDGFLVRTKKLETIAGSLEYSLTCVNATNEQTGQIAFNQCVFLNGIVDYK